MPATALADIAPPENHATAVDIARRELGRHADTVARQAARRLPPDAGAQAVLSAS